MPSSPQMGFTELSPAGIFAGTVIPLPASSTAVQPALPSPNTPTQGILITPVPTRLRLLSLDQVESAVLSLLADNGGCRLPCWWGIAPGETTWAEASSFLSQFDPEIEVWESEGGSELAHVDISVSRELASLGLIDISLLVRDGLVDSIFVDNLAWHGYNLAGLLETYGIPGEVWLSTYNRLDMGIIPFKLALLYPDRGIAALYMKLVRVNDGTIWGCFRGNPVVGLKLWSPQGEKTLEEVAKRLAWGWNIEGESFRPVSEVTRYDLADFYQHFKDPQTDPCIDTLVRYWPSR